MNSAILFTRLTQQQSYSIYWINALTNSFFFMDFNRGTAIPCIAPTNGKRHYIYRTYILVVLPLSWTLNLTVPFYCLDSHNGRAILFTGLTLWQGKILWRAVELHLVVFQDAILKGLHAIIRAGNLGWILWDWEVKRLLMFKVHAWQ